MLASLLGGGTLLGGTALGSTGILAVIGLVIQLIIAILGLGGGLLGGSLISPIF